MLIVYTGTEMTMNNLFIYYRILRQAGNKMFEMIKDPDLLELIFRYLDPASVKAASLVSR